MDMSARSGDHQRKGESNELLHKAASLAPWGFPLDSEAGPGSYENSEKIGHSSFKFINPPKLTIPLAKKSSKVFVSKEMEKSQAGNESPGVGLYSPNMSLSIPTLPKIGIGTGKARDLQEMENMKLRSPGPIYAYSEKAIGRLRHNSSVRGMQACFSKSQRKNMFSVSALPSPVSYSPSGGNSRVNSPSFKQKDEISKLYFPNYMRYLKGKESPGPAAYDFHPLHLGRSIEFGRKLGEKAVKDQPPGPGAYGNTSSLGPRKLGRFGKSQRNLDPRMCKNQTDSVSHLYAKY